MKILLMLPASNLAQLWGRLAKGAGNNNFSYGLASLAAYLLAHGYDVEILDPQFLDGPQELEAWLARGGFDMVGISTYTPTVAEAFATARLCRQALPRTTLVMGGPHCAYFPEQTLADCPELNYVVAREGEETLLELARLVESGQGHARDILGLVWRDGDRVVANPPRPFLDVDSLPTPAYHLFPLHRYKLQPTVYKRLPTYTTLVSRGCPYQCSFCHAFEVLGRRMRYRAVEAVIDELAGLMRDQGARGFMFYDSTFTFNRRWVVSFCQEVLRRGMDFTWMCLTRSDRVDAELLRLMRRAGCYAVSFGAESGNQSSLDMLKKGASVEQNALAIRLAKQAGMYVTATYMIGLPGEGEAEVMNTLRFAKANPTPIAHFFWPIPYPKTLFYEQCLADGGLRTDLGWESYNIYAPNPVYVNPRLGLEGMRRLQRRLYRDYYSDPRVLALNLKSITTWTDVKKYLQAGMAIWGMWKK